MKQYPVKTVKINNGEILAYRDTQTLGPLVLLVHGNMSSSVHFQEVMMKLESQYRVISVDLRGFGDSSYNRRIDSLRDFSDDVISFIEMKNFSQLTLLGWSTGGGVVLEIAATIPDKIKKVILLDSVGVQGFKMYEKDNQGQPILTKLITTREQVSSDPVQVLPILNAYETKNKDFLRMIWDATIYNLNKPSDEDYDYYLEAMLKQRNLVDVDYSLITFNMTNEHNGVVEGTNRLDLIQAPVVIFHGKKDLIVPYHEAEKTKKIMGNRSKLVAFENEGHSIITDNLELFIDKLKSHID